MLTWVYLMDTTKYADGEYSACLVVSIRYTHRKEPGDCSRQGKIGLTYRLKDSARVVGKERPRDGEVFVAVECQRRAGDGGRAQLGLTLE